MEKVKLTKEEKAILIEYAKWYDSCQASPEELVNEFEEQRGKDVVNIESEPKQEAFSL